MVTTTPLLLLLDGILSQDEERTDLALRQIQELVPNQPLSESPLRSAYALEGIIQTLMTYQPHLAQVASKHDGSLPLHFAASIGNVRVAKLLIEKYRTAACTPNSKGKIPLHYAAREGRADMVTSMLQMVPQTASILSKKGKLALHFAAGEGHTEVVQALLRVYPKGASLPSKKGKVAIHFAARWGHMTIAKDLYRICPECISTLDYEGSLPLHDAAREGQLEMAQFLVERYPEGLSKENIRGESPLYPAVRSGNMDVCVYMVKAWPKGGKNVLQRVVEDDNVQNWDEGLLDLCLRGAVNNFTDCSLTEGQGQCQSSSRPTYRLFPLSASTSEGEATGDLSDASNATASSPAQDTPLLAPMLDITIPRSKSPILEEGGSRKKRSSVCDDCGGNKRSRRGSQDEEDPLSSLHVSSHRPFYQVHAALECGASSPVLKCVLDRHPEHLQEIDDLGKLPLHLAVEHGSDEIASIVLDKIWKPYKEACLQREFLGRLPLHLALKSRADCRIIQALLDSNPCSGVEHCDVVETKFIDKLPIYMATESRCDLSTVYMLVRGDPSVVQSWKCLKQYS
jgi:ankyrin repeat protein